MFYVRKTRKEFDVWPAYVDILATVLMVLIFILMTFVIAQLYLSDSITNKDIIIGNLNQKISLLGDNLENEKKRTQETISIIEKLKEDIQKHQLENQKLINNKECLEIDFKKLSDDVSRITKLLNEESEENKKDKIIISELKANLSKLVDELTFLKESKKELDKENEKYKELKKVHSYRSEFFTQLKSAIGDIDDIKIVGDRFVFQSELLFDMGSAELGEEGQKQLKNLSRVLKDISKKIPDDINWILRIDGHTDKKPIKTAFPSNWELSSARAIAVLKFLIKEGIPERRLVAAGFGEFQPLTSDLSEKENARNRRIEFKLDQR
jgi:chemotaxis protein MotB